MNNAIAARKTATRTTHGQEWFAIQEIREKIRSLPEALEQGLKLTAAVHFDERLTLGRDVRVVAPSQLPDKPGLASKEGQARLLHDLASIELQAMELAARTLFEFPEAPQEFRENLVEIALGEARHLGLCLQGLDDLGFPWGHWAVHNALWDAVHPSDSLIDRVVIVHRYLEGAGLDAGEALVRRLTGVSAPETKVPLDTIVREEVEHVEFGSRWYRNLCREAKIDADLDFRERMFRLSTLIPRREKIAVEARRRGGFTDLEIASLQAAKQLALEAWRSRAHEPKL